MVDAPYPAEWETDIVLGDGSTAHLRPIRPEDRDRLEAFHGRQSQESIYFRFFRYRPELSNKELEYFTQVDYERRMAFVATVGDQIVAIARYEQWDSPKHPGEKRAEVAFFVDDHHHGKGLATIMLEYLAAAGRRKKFDGFTATVLPQNVGMLRVFRKAGFEVSTGFEDGVIDVSLGIEVTDSAADAIEGRERRAQARSISRLIAPGSIAVIGASRTPGAVGHELVRSIVRGDYRGSVIAVNPAAKGEDIAGVPSVAALGDIEEPIDLAIISVPADAVESVVADCASAGVAGLLIITAGFSDAGPQGLVRERRLADLARGNGMRVLGPNAFGLVNTDPEVSLQALFVPVRVSDGSVGLLSQSGPLAGGLLQHFDRAGIGVSTMVAVGNRADVSVNDLLQFWAEDERTRVVALYLENIGNPRKFTRIARQVSQSKPIVMVAPSDEIVASMLEESGVVLVRHVAELVSQVDMMVSQPPANGSRIAILSNASSIGRLAASAVRRAGLEVVEPGAIGSGSPDAVIINDTDTIALAREANFESYEKALVAAAVSSEVDLVLVALVPTATLSLEQLDELVRRVDKAVDKPMAVTGLGGQEPGESGQLPIFDYPEEAAMALGRTAQYGRWLRRPHDDEVLAEPEFEERARATVIEALGADESVHLGLTDSGLPALLSGLGIPVPEYVLAESAQDAKAAANEVGYPVVLKAGGMSGRAPGEAGGAAIDLHNASAVSASVQRMVSNLGDALLPIIVQRQSASGFHLRIELEQSWERGSHLSFGVGGFVGKHISHGLSMALPLSESRLAELIEESWLSNLAPAGPTRTALIEIVHVIALAADAVPELTHLRADPVLVADGVCSIVDIEVELSAPQNDPLTQVRHLT